MRAAIGVELRRLFARRLVRGLVLLVVLGIAFGAVATYVSSDDLAGALEGAEIERSAMFESCVASDGFGAGQNLPPEFESVEDFCRTQIPSASDLASTFVYSEMGEEGLIGTAPLLSIIGLLIGASFIGAEWQAGSMTTLLTWEPRRVVVIVAKMIAAVLGVGLIVLLLQALLLLIFLPVGLALGSTAGVDATWLEQTAATAARISTAGGLTALIGVSIATIGRHTTAALGVAFAYFAIIESLLRGLKPHWRPWFVGDNLVVLITADRFEIESLGHTALEAGLTVGGYALLVFALAVVFFQRRDVT